MKNKVTCDTQAQFIVTVAGFVKQGLTFTADAGTLTIILTGGF